MGDWVTKDFDQLDVVCVNQAKSLKDFTFVCMSSTVEPGYYMCKCNGKLLSVALADAALSMKVSVRRGYKVATG